MSYLIMPVQRIPRYKLLLSVRLDGRSGRVNRTRPFADSLILPPPAGTQKVFRARSDCCKRQSLERSGKNQIWCSLLASKLNVTCTCFLVQRERSGSSPFIGTTAAAAAVAAVSESSPRNRMSPGGKLNSTLTRSAAVQIAAQHAGKKTVNRTALRTVDLTDLISILLVIEW